MQNLVGSVMESICVGIPCLPLLLILCAIIAFAASLATLGSSCEFVEFTIGIIPPPGGDNVIKTESPVPPSILPSPTTFVEGFVGYKTIYTSLGLLRFTFREEGGDDNF
jgi:hypothetical protein